MSSKCNLETGMDARIGIKLPMRRFVNFNENWMYAPKWLDHGAQDTSFSPIALPHSNQIFNHAANVDNEDYQFIATYRKHFNLDSPNPDTQVILNFEGVMLASAIHLNGEQIAENLGGFQPFSIDLSPFLQDGDNTLTVYVDSRERKDIPPYGHLVDYLTFGGIYREASLMIVSRTHIEDVFVQTQDVLSAPKAACQVTLSNEEPGLTLQASLLNAKGEVLAKTKAQVQSLQQNIYFEELPDIQLWSLDHPNLYTLRVTLQRENETIDSLDTRFGFRTAEFRSDGGFYLNGDRVDLFGLNRHQSYPYIGAAAPARLQSLDADILKHDLACNIVRTSHYPQSRHFLDRCDEIGLLVFEEIAGWQHIGDKKMEGTRSQRPESHDSAGSESSFCHPLGRAGQ